jgi:hypothetical protein
VSTESWDQPGRPCPICKAADPAYCRCDESAQWEAWRTDALAARLAEAERLIDSHGQEFMRLRLAFPFGDSRRDELVDLAGKCADFTNNRTADSA